MCSLFILKQLILDPKRMQKCQSVTPSDLEYTVEFISVARTACFHPLLSRTGRLARYAKCPDFFMNINEDDLIHIGLIRFIALFILSHGGNRNQQEGCVTLMWIAAL